MAQRKVLVISGEKTLLDLLAKNLTASGYEIKSVEEDDPEMESFVSSEQPDLIIVDIMMPKMKGITVSLKIRKRFNVPIIMLTSQSTSREKVRSLDLSSAGSLSDPVDMGVIKNWIEETFSRNNAIGFNRSDAIGNNHGSGNEQNA